MSLDLSTGRRTVCIDCRYIRQRPSGIGVVVQAIVDRVPRLAPDLDFLLLKHPEAPDCICDAPNVTEVVVPQEANGPATLFFLPAVVDLRFVDLFHCPFNILPHGLRMPTVVTVCDVMWLKTPQHARSPGWWGMVEQPFYQHGTWRSLRHATRIIAISRATLSEIASLDEAAAGRTRVVLEGVSGDFRPLRGKEEKERADRVRARSVPGGGRYVLTVGQYVGYKNHDAVVRAFGIAFGSDPAMHLVLVQRLGKSEKVIGRLADSLGVGGRVHVLNEVPRGDLVALYDGAVALCHPSLVEGFGNPVAEAMACGCPVVTSNRSSMPEVAAGAARLVNPEDPADIARALVRVACNPDLAESMRKRGLSRAKNLSWDACANGTLAVYREALGDLSVRCA
jgi:glycosyltransferase involved in cell wall biosynthesis